MPVVSIRPDSVYALPRFGSGSVFGPAPQLADDSDSSGVNRVHEYGADYSWTHCRATMPGGVSPQPGVDATITAVAVRVRYVATVGVWLGFRSWEGTGGIADPADPPSLGGRYSTPAAGSMTEATATLDSGGTPANPTTIADALYRGFLYFNLAAKGSYVGPDSMTVTELWLDLTYEGDWTPPVTATPVRYLRPCRRFPRG